MSLSNATPTITITTPQATNSTLYARLISYQANGDASLQDISTPWIPADVQPTSAADDVSIQELADSLISAYTDDLLFVKAPILLCISPLDETPNQHISMPSGTTETLTDPITASQLVASLAKWISRWRSWQHCSSIHSTLISTEPSITACGPVTSFERAADPSRLQRTCNPKRHPELWVNPSSVRDEEPWVSPNPDPRAILIAEDNQINCIVLCKMLFKMGVNFKIAENGQEAFDEYTRDPERYWCVFMDLSMPVVDGYTSSRWIREFEKERGLEPCVLVRMHYGQVEDGPRADVFDYFLDKPIMMSRISGILNAEKERELQRAGYLESV